MEVSGAKGNLWEGFLFPPSPLFLSKPASPVTPSFFLLDEDKASRATMTLNPDKKEKDRVRATQFWMRKGGWGENGQPFLKRWPFAPKGWNYEAGRQYGERIGFVAGTPHPPQTPPFLFLVPCSLFPVPSVPIPYSLFPNPYPPRKLSGKNRFVCLTRHCIHV